jgi:hypothetical protein
MRHAAANSPIPSASKVPDIEQHLSERRNKRGSGKQHKPNHTVGHSLIIGVLE